MNEYKWVFGLAIDEELTWGAAKVSVDPHADHLTAYSPLVEDFKSGRLADIRTAKKSVNLPSVIRTSLDGLKDRVPGLFRSVVAVGVSTIDVEYRNKGDLVNKWGKPVNIARRGWVNLGNNVVLRFSQLFDGLFDNAHTPVCIGVQNDATAKCLAEFYWQKPHDRVDSIYYVMFCPTLVELFPELSTKWSCVYPMNKKTIHDLEEGEPIGYIVHTFCSGNKGSGNPILDQWIADLSFPKDEFYRFDTASKYLIHIWPDLISYGAIEHDPMRVILAGSLVFPSLIGDVIEDLAEVGRKYSKNSGFIQPASLVRNANTLGALEVARLTFLKKLPGVVEAS